MEWSTCNFNVPCLLIVPEALAQEVDGTHGCYFVPAFSGLFCPYWQDSARGWGWNMITCSWLTNNVCDLWNDCWRLIAWKRQLLCENTHTHTHKHTHYHAFSVSDKKKNGFKGIKKERYCWCVGVTIIIAKCAQLFYCTTPTSISLQLHYTKCSYFTADS